MKLFLEDINNKPIEKIYKSFRICYSKLPYRHVQVPTLNSGEIDYEKMINFIKPLMAEMHTSPLEHVSVTFSVEGMSRACLAQLTRHRTFRFSCQSQRYVDGNNFDFVLEDLDYIEDEAKRVQAKEKLKEAFLKEKEMYQELIDLGVKKEDARGVLGQSTTCNLVFTCDLNNLRNFLRQRMCSHAQREIREMAKQMCIMVKEHVPFIDYKVMLCQQGICGKGCFTGLK